MFAYQVNRKSLKAVVGYCVISTYPDMKKGIFIHQTGQVTKEYEANATDQFVIEDLVLTAFRSDIDIWDFEFIPLRRQ